MILFESIKYKNFLSTGETPVCINLNKYASTVITGTNGNGKSTFLDAIVYCLFGKTYRKIKLGNLVNNINNGGLEVECCFSINNNKYKIIRGMKPSIFEIYVNDNMIPQPASSKDYQMMFEDDIIKLNYKTFCQIVILGSASFVPFMQMPLGTRREIIENILDIDIFTRMRDVLKSVNTELLSDISVLTHSIDMVKNTYKMKCEFLAERKDSIEHKKIRLLNYVDTKKQELEKYLITLDDLISSRDILLDKLKHIPLDTQTKIDGIKNKLYDLKSEIDRNHKSILFYQNNSNCDQCGQKIDDDYKSDKINTLKQNNVDYLLKTKEYSDKISEYNVIIDNKSSLDKKLIEIDSAIKVINVKIESFNKIIEDTNEEINNVDISGVPINELELEIKTINNEIEELEKKLKSKKHLLNYYKISNGILKDDGVRTLIIGQYIPIINQTINKYLNALDFSINFVFDNNFNEKIHSNHYHDFTYYSFSEGEKIRIDLALLFTWRYISSLKSRNMTNLLIFDEIFDGSLDNEGISLFMDIIAEENEGKNVFIITHKSSSNDGKFDVELKFIKKGHFSSFEEIS